MWRRRSPSPSGGRGHCGRVTRGALADWPWGLLSLGGYPGPSAAVPRNEEGGPERSRGMTPETIPEPPSSRSATKQIRRYLIVPRAGGFSTFADARPGRAAGAPLLRMARESWVPPGRPRRTRHDGRTAPDWPGPVLVPQPPVRLLGALSRSGRSDARPRTIFGKLGLSVRLSFRLSGMRVSHRQIPRIPDYSTVNRCGFFSVTYEKATPGWCPFLGVAVMSKDKVDPWQRDYERELRARRQHLGRCRCGQ